MLAALMVIRRRHVNAFQRRPPALHGAYDVESLSNAVHLARATAAITPKPGQASACTPSVGHQRSL